jgi:14-3-3 protein epsilon
VPAHFATPVLPDVVRLIKDVAFDFNGRLTIDERSLLSVAYKNITNTLRCSWRTMDAIEKAEAQSEPAHLRLVQRQRERIELELAEICSELMNLLDKRLVPAAKAGEETVFYLKM